MASKRKLWNQLGRFLTGAVVVCFFLPFFGVSCEGMEIVTVSGADMVGGCKPGGLITTMAEQGAGDPGDGPGELVASVERVEREPLAIVALAIAVALFGLAWVRRRQALVAACLLALAGLGSLGGLYVQVDGDLDDAVELGMKERGTDDGPAIDIKKDAKIDAGSRMGFWAACLGLLGVAALTGLALREKDGPPAPAPPPEARVV